MFSALPPYNLNEMNSYNLFNDFIMLFVICCYIYIIKHHPCRGCKCYTRARRSAPLSYYVHIISYIHTYIHTYTRTHRTHVSDRNRIRYRNTYIHIHIRTHTLTCTSQWQQPDPRTIRQDSQNVYTKLSSTTPSQTPTRTRNTEPFHTKHKNIGGVGKRFSFRFSKSR